MAMFLAGLSPKETNGMTKMSGSRLVSGSAIKICDCADLTTEF